MNDVHSLSHTKWNCKYHIKWVNLVLWDILREKVVLWYLKNGVIWNINIEIESFGVEDNMLIQ